MIILDTNIVSALMVSPPEKLLLSWLDRQPRLSVWITSVTILEVEYGLQIMPLGKRRSALVEAFGHFLGKLEERIASFDASSATHTADLMAARKRVGRPRDVRDTMIAGIAVARHATLATRNTAHFQDLPIEVVNPWLIGKQ